jgi:D-alanine transaminase
MSIVYLNGQFLPKSDAKIPVEDRGFIFGDGIYEGVRSVEGRLFEWDAHAERMVNGLSGIRIGFDAAQVASLRRVCEQLVEQNQLGDAEAFLYLEVTRGAAPRTHYFPAAGTPPTVFVSATKLVVPRTLREQGGAAVTFPDMRWARCDWKTTNLLGNVLARQAAQEAGAYEAILLRDGVVTEGAATNAFAVVDGVIRTHPLTTRILPGITRQVVMRLIAEYGFTVLETAVTEAELRRAEEIFVVGSTTDVTPIVTLDGTPVAGGAPGPITTRLREGLEALLYAPAASTR